MPKGFHKSKRGPAPGTRLKTTRLNYRIRPDVKRKFKAFAESKGMTMTEFLERAGNYYIDTEFTRFKK